MKLDINLIVDVEPEAAQLLIDLIETLIEETFVRREARKNHIQKVTVLEATKKNAPTAPADEASTT